MIRDIVIYPDKRINITAPDLRLFDDDLASVIQDLKDTMQAHNTNALAAIQIAIPMAVIVVKQPDGTYLEIINPRIIGKEGSVEATESTLYFPNTKHTIKRYEKIRLIYQDREGKQQSLVADGDLAILLQRKIDYVYGGTLANRVSEKDRKAMEKNLSTNGMQGSFETCPTVFRRDYFISFVQKILFLMILTLFSPLFPFEKETLLSMATFDKYATIVALLTLVGYFFVALDESKKYKSCTSCQMGNIVGTTIKYLVGIIAIYTLSAYILN